jgi:DNA primase
VSTTVLSGVLRESSRDGLRVAQCTRRTLRSRNPRREDRVPYPREYIDDLLAQVDVVEVVRSFVRLQGRKGRHGHVGLCPFHREKTASFVVLPDKQFYVCHACGARGNAIHFLTEYRGISYPQAVMYLAHRYKFYPKQWLARKKKRGNATK